MATGAPPAPPAVGQMDLDELDHRIVQALRADGRRSIRSLAETLHVSRATTYARVQRLEHGGVITGYTATVDPQRLGNSLSAYVYLRIAQASSQTLRRRLLEMPEIEHGAMLSGDFDIVLLVRTPSAASLRDVVLTTLQDMPEVLSTQTVLIFEEFGPRT